jgi:hypothetical protein
MKRLHRLRKLQRDAERRDFPEGLAEREALFAHAEQAAGVYFKNNYGVR